MPVTINNQLKSNGFFDSKNLDLIYLLYSGSSEKVFVEINQEPCEHKITIRIPGYQLIELFYRSNKEAKETPEEIWSSFFNYYDAQKRKSIFFTRSSSFWQNLFKHLEDRAAVLGDFNLPYTNSFTRKMRWLLNLSTFKGKRYVAATASPKPNKNTPMIEIPCHWRAVTLNNYDFVLEIPENEGLDVFRDCSVHLTN